MIVITGATGHLGKSTIDFLLKKGVPANTITAFVRDENKAADLKAKGINLKTGTYNDYTSMLAAFKGADKLLLISGNDLHNRSEQQENAVKAAKEAGVKHILYTSFERKNETETSPIAIVAKSHLDTENHIKASGLTYTIFRNNIYMDMLPMFLGPKVLETGVFFPAGNGKIGFTLRDDMAEATANVLIEEGHENKEYIISNPELVTMQQVADDLSKISEKKISYTTPSPEAYANALVQAGVPKEYVGVSVGFAEAMKQGELETSKEDLSRLLGREPARVADYLAKVYAKVTAQ